MKWTLFFVLSWTLFALDIKIDSDNFKKFNRTLSEEKNIQKLLSEPIIDMKSLQHNSTNDFDNSTQRTKLQNEYAKVKMLLVYLKPSVTQDTLKIELRKSLYKKYASVKEEFTFVYKLSYPTQGVRKGDLLFENLQQKISLYILEKYGIANIDEKIQQINNEFSSTTQSFTLGTTESNPHNNLDNPYHFESNTTSRSGIVSFYFYPFVIINQNSKKMSKNSTQNATIQSEFVQVNSPYDVDKLNFKLSLEDKERIRTFLLSSYKPITPNNISQLADAISQKTLKYSQIAQELFKKYPQAQTLGDLDRIIQKKLDAIAILHKHQTYTYFIDLSNDDDLEYVLLPAFRKLTKNLRRDTRVNSLRDTQVLHNEDFQKETTNSLITPIIKNVSLKIYKKPNGLLGLYTRADVSFEQSDVCKQYIKGISSDKLYGLSFIQLEYQDKMIEVAQTELTNKLFFKLLPKTKQDKWCQATRGKNEPVNCLNYQDLDNLIKKLNKQSKRYRYRFLTCQEASFLATCGNKQKYCWGYTPNYTPFEHLSQNKYAPLHTVAQKKPNGLNLYDFCGNAQEYCIDKRGRYKAYGVKFSNLQFKIYKNSYTDLTTVRLVRERR